MSTMDENKAQWVRNLCMHCLYRDEEIVDGKPPAGALIVDAIVHQMAFHPARIEQKREEIRQLLNAMPESFHVGGGGGMSFLNLCVDRNGMHWAEHSTMAELCALGLAAKMAAYPLPRPLWGVLPGGVPYVTFNTREDATAQTPASEGGA